MPIFIYRTYTDTEPIVSLITVLLANLNTLKMRVHSMAHLIVVKFRISSKTANGQR